VISRACSCKVIELKKILMENFKTISFQKTGEIARIQLNRPEGANALDEQLARELAAAALMCDADRAVRCVMLTAQGRFFCAGGDVRSMLAADATRAAKVKTLADLVHRAISSFARMRAPLVVAVNGAAAGAGLGLAMCGDLVLAAQSARFTMAYTTIGLSPDGAATYYLPRLIGLRKTQELAFTNRILTAEEALEWGLLTSVVPDLDLEREAQDLAQQIAAGPLAAHANVKSLLAGTYASGLEAQMEMEGRLIAAQSVSADAQEGLTAFANKRQPRFNSSI
jgi:2-(1,2-epoxy-1,2-dihydrophenyl)acetyl-CoA isomerase